MICEAFKGIRRHPLRKDAEFEDANDSGSFIDFEILLTKSSFEEAMAFNIVMP